MYKEKVGSAVRKDIKVQADSGFQDIADYHANSETLKKKPKGGSSQKKKKLKTDAFLQREF